MKITVNKPKPPGGWPKPEEKLDERRPRLGTNSVETRVFHFQYHAAMVHSKVRLETTRNSTGVSVHIYAIQSDGRLSAECRSLRELEEEIQFLERELEGVRREAAKQLHISNPAIE